MADLHSPVHATSWWSAFSRYWKLNHVRDFRTLFDCDMILIFHTSNNSMRTKMTSIGLSVSTIDNLIGNPTILHPLLSSNVSSPSVNPLTALTILDAYTRGVHIVFILNAALAAVCVLVAAVMIKHNELERGDEAEMRQHALEKEKANESVVRNENKEEVSSQGPEGQLEENGAKR